MTNRKANWVAKCWNQSYHIQVHPSLKQTLLLFIRVSSGCLDSRIHCGTAVWLITSIRNLGVADYNGIIFKVTPTLYDKWMDFRKRAWGIGSAGHKEIAVFCFAITKFHLNLHSFFFIILYFLVLSYTLLHSSCINIYVTSLPFQQKVLKITHFNRA